MTTEHTPTPWKANLTHNEPCVYAGTGSGRGIAYMQAENTPHIENSAERAANAAFIVRACNAHEDLVAALREAQAALNGAPNTVGLHTQIDAALAKAGAA